MMKRFYLLRTISLLILFFAINTGNANATPYCTPYNGSVFASSGGVNVISYISVPYTGLINSTTNTNSFGYSDFAFTTAPIFHVNSTYTINATVANAGEVMAWIDYNHDSTFQNTEKVTMTITGTTATGSVTIPNTALPGNTKLRIMAAEKPNILLGPCGNTTKGEGEDYLITITGPTSCAMPNTLTSTGTTSTRNTLKWMAMPGTTSEYAFATTITAPTSGIVATATDNAQLTGLTGGTKYYVFVRAICGATDFSDWAVDSFTTTVCNPPAITVSPIGNTEAHVTFLTGTGATATEYVMSVSSTPPASGTITTLTALDLTGLAPGKQYCIHMRSICSGTDTSAWVTQCFTTTTVSVGQVNAGIATYYPNPVKDVLTVKLLEDAALSLSDVSGKEIMHTNSKDGKAVINMSTLNNGVYFLRFIGEHRSGTVRVLKNAE